MYKRNLRKERAAAGLCSTCGGRLDTDGKTCSVCRKKSRNNYHWYQSIGICPVCKKEKLYGTEKTCPECKAKAAFYAALRWEKMTESEREAQRKRKNEKDKIKYHICKNSNICVKCKKRKNERNCTMCSICRVRERENDRKRHHNLTGDYIPRYERISYGLCYCCGKPLDRDGRACKACSDIRIANFSKNFGKNNTYWKADNAIVFSQNS